MLNEMAERGLALRKEILGADFVERAMADAGDVGRPVQDLANAFCWGYIWRRPGLSHRDRSLLNIGIAGALNRSSELRAQVKAALHNGLTRAEIAEAVLQIAVYCGLPAAIESAKIAQEALEES